jgi:acetolactate synthase I/II/III large subunit
MKISEYLVRSLELNGFEQAFCVTGGAASNLMDSLRNSEIKTVHNHHEQACAMAADAYARIIKKPALVLCTNGPGVTNLITGVAGAYQDSIPMFVITGQVSNKHLLSNSKFDLRQLGVQEIETEPLVTSITKYYRMVTSPNEIEEIVKEAIWNMNEGRMGPVWLEIPLDIQNEETTLIPRVQTTNLTILDLELDAPIELLQKAKKPLVIAGNGIHLSNSESQFLEFIKTSSLPFVSTWSASDLCSSQDELYIGNFGILGQRAANFAVQNADVLLVLGSRLSIPNIGYEFNLFAKNAQIIMVDIDPNEIQKETLNVAIEVLSDLKRFFLNFQSKIQLKTEYANWIQNLQTLKQILPLEIESSISQTEKIDSYVFTKILSHSLTDEAVVTDMGTSFTCTMQSLENNGLNRLITSSALSSMGFGLAGSIGVSSIPGQKTICIAGDGGFQMNVQELQTIRDNNLDIKIFVLNSNGYLAISIMQENSFEGRYFGANPISGVGAPDFVAIGNAYGIPSEKLDWRPEFAKSQIKRILNSSGPILCEVPISEKQKMRPRVQSIRNKEGKFRSPSLEVMWPPLPEDLDAQVKKILEKNS